MSKHTPGPWFHNTEGAPKPDVRAASGRSVAVTWMVCSSAPKSAECYQARTEEDRANARLIAAAPDLLEALQMGYAETMDYIRLNNLGAENNQWLQLARAAIAKATGSTV